MLRFLKAHWKKFAIAIVVLAVAGFVARKTVLKPPPQYETAVAETKNLTKTLEVSGQINADQKAILKFQTAGKLTWIGVKAGDKVKKWQAIASLDKSILKKKLANELSDYMHQRWDFDQIREDNQVTTDNYDDYSFTNTIERLIEQEQFLLNKAITDVEIQDLTNKLATLISPLDGIVTDIDTPVAGVNVTVTDAIDIVDPQTLYFEVEIDETDIGQIQVGQKTDIILEAYPDETIESEIIWIDFAASTSDSGSTVFLAKLKLPQDDSLKLRLGLTGDATIVLEQKTDVLSIPIDALEEQDGQAQVKVLQGKQAVDTPIETGLETDDDIEVISGISQGTIIITGEKEK